MGPNLIFDKSLLQSLSVDESVWLDNFFYSVITPLFFIETLADLEKAVKIGRTPEDFVGSLAAKTPDSSVCSIVFHKTLIAGELLGTQTIDMINGRPVVGGGINAHSENKNGVVFKHSPEEEALIRWQKKDFLELERSQAKEWREMLYQISPEKQQMIFQGWFGDVRTFTLDEIKKFVDSYIDEKNQRSVFEFGLSFLGVSSLSKIKVLERWNKAGCPLLREFAPYFCFVYSIDLFFYLARSADLISERTSNLIDIAYLYYLPFCMVFTSSDKLHKKTVPLFLRPNQSFIWGLDLKADLQLLDQHYSSLPDDILRRGLCSFASNPPEDISFEVTKLWDKHMKADWRNLRNFATGDKNNPFEKKMVKEINEAVKNAKENNIRSNQDTDDVKFIITEHYVSKTKGKWN